MYGHYPRVCYKAQGMRPLPEQPFELEIQGLRVQGTRYEFLFKEPGRPRRVVLGIMILPDGRFVREMSDLDRAGSDYLRRFYGASQIQIVMDGPIAEDEALAIFRTFIGANMPLIQTLRSGGQP